MKHSMTKIIRVSFPAVSSFCHHYHHHHDCRRSRMIFHWDFAINKFNMFSYFSFWCSFFIILVTIPTFNYFCMIFIIYFSQNWKSETVMSFSNVSSFPDYVTAWMNLTWSFLFCLLEVYICNDDITWMIINSDGHTTINCWIVLDIVQLFGIVIAFWVVINRG